MTAYTATFSNGRTLEIKKSTREYGFAYLWIGFHADGARTGGSGFARTLDLAHKAMSREQGYLRHAPVMPRHRALPPATIAYYQKAIRDWRPGRVEFAEVVEVVRS